MTGRQLGWIFGVLALLSVTWLAVRFGGGDEPAAGLDLGARVTPDVRLIHIERPGAEPLEVSRRDGRWTVNGYPASDSVVTTTLGKLDTLAAGRLIARRASSHPRLGLTPDSAVRVRIGPADAPAAEFLVGKASREGRFVRLPEADEAYVIAGGALDPFVGSERGWRDFTIARVDTAALRRIVIRRRGEPAGELTRSTAAASGWALSAGDGAAPADTAAMRIYLRLLADLQATGFPADSFVYAADFEAPAAVVELYLDGGDGTDAGRVPDTSLLFSTGGDHPDVLVRRAVDPIVYAIDRTRANILTTAAERLRQR